MTTGKSDANYSDDGTTKTIDFFGVKGVQNRGGPWLMNTGWGGTFHEVDRELLTKRAREPVIVQLQSTRGSEARPVYISPQQAVVFFLVGHITPENLERKTEAFGIIKIPGVVMDGVTFNVCVVTAANWRDLPVAVMRENVH